MLQCLVVLDAGVLAVGILLRVLVGLVGGNFFRNLVGNAFLHALRISEQAAELVIKGLHDIGELVQFRLGFTPAPGRRHGFNLRIGIRQGDGQSRLLLGAVATLIKANQGRICC